MDDLRKALVLLARALPEAEARLVQATVNWKPDNAVQYAALCNEVQRLRSELERVAAQIERLDGCGGLDGS